MEKKNNRGGARPGAGRPKGTTGAYKEVTKIDRVALRLSREEMQKLNECSEILQKNKTKTIIEAIEILHQKLKNN